MNYQFIYLPIIAGVLTQAIKLFLDARKNQFSWKDLNSYGGMPSSHAAYVSSLAATVGYYEGWDSAAFGVALILMILIIRDAAGLRRIVGKQAETLNKIIHNLPADQSFQFEHLRERVGHTPLQLLIGSIIGIVIVAINALIF